MANEISKERFDQLEKLFTKKCRSIARQFCSPQESAVAGYIFFKIGLNSLMALPAPIRLQLGQRVIDDITPLFKQLKLDGEFVKELNKFAGGETKSD